MTNCEGLTHSASCTEEGLDISIVNEGNNDANALLNLPVGTRILNQEGDVIHTVKGDPKKITLKIPAV